MGLHMEAYLQKKLLSYPGQGVGQQQLQATPGVFHTSYYPHSVVSSCWQRLRQQSCGRSSWSYCLLMTDHSLQLGHTWNPGG